MERVELTGPDLMFLSSLIHSVRPDDLVRVWFDDGVKVKVNGGMWSPPLGTVNREDY